MALNPKGTLIVIAAMLGGDDADLVGWRHVGPNAQHWGRPDRVVRIIACRKCFSQHHVSERPAPATGAHLSRAVRVLSPGFPTRARRQKHRNGKGACGAGRGGPSRRHPPVGTFSTQLSFAVKRARSAYRRPACRGAAACRSAILRRLKPAPTKTQTGVTSQRAMPRPAGCTSDLLPTSHFTLLTCPATSWPDTPSAAA
jgi:hypothetical protein